MAQQFSPLEWQDFPGEDTEQLSLLLREAVADPIFDFRPWRRKPSPALAEQQPAFARRFVELHGALRRANQRLRNGSTKTLAVDSHGGRAPAMGGGARLVSPFEQLCRPDRIAPAEVLAAAIAGQDAVPTTRSPVRTSCAAARDHCRNPPGKTRCESFDAGEGVLRGSIPVSRPPKHPVPDAAYHVAATTLGEAIPRHLPMRRGCAAKSRASC